ncbi:MAG TPA: phage major capsid protein [Pseudonocardiaceae bacterium]|nr:phage major capsid protein [Pseudonocardiaceae bacterium]
MSVLQKLLESRGAAQKAYDDFVTPLREAMEKANTDEERAAAALTDEQTTRKNELRSAVEELDVRIDEVDADEQRAKKLSEVRTRIGAGAPNAEVNEARTYEEGSPHSYVADLVRAFGGPQWKGHNEAVRRLNQHEYEVAVEISRGSKEGKRALRLLRESHRTENGADARRIIEEMRERGNAGAGRGREGLGEHRAMDTTASSGGSFTTPVYIVPEYAPYREAGRAFIDQCNGQPMPDYGMTVFIPHVTSPAGVAAQVGQNSGITENDPNAGYLSANITTEAGQVPVSQQLLDRAGPNFSYDKMVFDQLNRDYAPKVDTYVLTQALAGAGTITYTDASGFTLGARSTPGTGGFYGKVSGAKAAVRTGAGVVMNPTHLFVQPNRWEYISGWVDSNGRPAVVPDYAGPFNAMAGGSRDGDAGIEGATGYRLNGLPAFQDLNIPAPGTGADQAVVGNLTEVYVFEGDLVPRVIPQTYAANLSVLLQVYAYIAVIVRYPTAIQTIAGSGMASITF